MTFCARSLVAALVLVVPAGSSGAAAQSPPPPTAAPPAQAQAAIQIRDNGARPVAAAKTGGPTAPCGALVADGVAKARAGSTAEAEKSLIAATIQCPDDAAPWRELGGLRFSEQRYREAVDYIERAARLAPPDNYLWELLASSRYLTANPAGALEAWNQLGTPKVGSVRITGAVRTPDRALVEALSLDPGDVLTPGRWERARRRASAVPAITDARLRYETGRDGTAAVEVIVDERPLYPGGLVPLAMIAARAAVLSDLRVKFGNPLRRGDQWTVNWRWKQERPRVGLELALPAPGGLPGVAILEGLWERQAYGLSSAPDGIIREKRQRAGLSLADWATGALRWQLGGAVDSFDRRTFVSAEALLDARLAGDRVSIGIGGGAWTPTGDQNRFTRAEVTGAWRSTRDSSRAHWLGFAEISSASAHAPLALWSGAGTGSGRTPFLRAHKLLESDVLNGAVFGRRAASATLEYVRPVVSTEYGALGVAGFMDAAKAWRLIDGTPESLWHADIGAGLRISGPGLGDGVRLDFAYGLQDGNKVLRVAFMREWPGR